MQKDNSNLEFHNCVNFEFIDSSRNNRTKALVIFDDSSEDICNSKAFVEIATAGRHRGLNTFHNKINLFHQIKFWRNAVLRNMHFVVFRSFRDAMEVSTLSAQLGLGSELVGW